MNPAIRFMITDTGIDFSIATTYLYKSPFSVENNPKVIEFPDLNRNSNLLHYFVFSINCTEIYNSDDTDELRNYEGDFYSVKFFLDGNLLYDTYYSQEQYDYLKNNQNTLDLKYFIIGRVMGGWSGYWHYAKMNVYTMRLYNKGLTEDEIVANYNTTKAYYSVITGE